MIKFGTCELHALVYNIEGPYLIVLALLYFFKKQLSPPQSLISSVKIKFVSLHHY